MTDQDAATLRRLIGIYGLDHVVLEVWRAVKPWPRRYDPVRKNLRAAYWHAQGSEEMLRKTFPKQDTNNTNNRNNGKMRSEARL